MANLDEMLREFAHIQEGLEAQQAQQRAGQRLEVPAGVVGLDGRYRGIGLEIHCIRSVSSSVPDTADTRQAVSGPTGSRYSGYSLYLTRFQIQRWIRISHLGAGFFLFYKEHIGTASMCGLRTHCSPSSHALTRYLSSYRRTCESLSPPCSDYVPPI